MAKDKDMKKEEVEYRKSIVVALSSNPAMVIDPSASDHAVAIAVSQRISLCVVAIVDKVNEVMEEEW